VNWIASKPTDLPEPIVGRAKLDRRHQPSSDTESDRTRRLEHGMTDRENESGRKSFLFNPFYALNRIFKARSTAQTHEDPATRARAVVKQNKWESVLDHILTGSMAYGSRTPVKDIPPWATLEVVTGGFATGNLIANGPLQDHELQWLKSMPKVPEGQERSALNARFLTTAGIAELREMLISERFHIEVPEEAALLVVSWLVSNQKQAQAEALIETIAPFFSKLRFYPVPRERPRKIGMRVHLRTVGEAIESLEGVKPNQLIQTQKDVVRVWLPMHDRTVALFLETVEDGWPCQKYPNDWKLRASALLAEMSELRTRHKTCGRIDNSKNHFAQLQGFLDRCVRSPESLTGFDVGRIRRILHDYLSKHGEPDSKSLIEFRRRQSELLRKPLHSDIARTVAGRLRGFPKDEGLEPADLRIDSITHDESLRTGLPEAMDIPPSIKRKAESCLDESVGTLVERGLIGSSESLAKCLPQMTSGIRAQTIEDPVLRNLYAAIYKVFRRRRSLLLTHFEKQVKLEELPWVGAIDQFRDTERSESDFARKALTEIVKMTLTAFPQTILPNKLVQEFRALAKSGNVEIPFVDELATDIFMRDFTPNFTKAAQIAADLMQGTLYSSYYDIDYAAVRAMPIRSIPQSQFMDRSNPEIASYDFADLCMRRSGIEKYNWNPAANGMIIEQQQILTTQNLAALFEQLDLLDSLRESLPAMARQCFEWICRIQQMKITDWQPKLRMIKNTAYAWRQMIFYLSFVSKVEMDEFLTWAQSHFEMQTVDFRRRFEPAMRGLSLAAKGIPLENATDTDGEVRRFLGWSESKHWLMGTSKE
jgi:hypothetical protein